MLAGFGVAAGMVYRAGVRELLPMINRLGWNLGWLWLYFFIPITCAGMAWRAFFAYPQSYSVIKVVMASWVGLACNWLLPVAQVGGELAKARLLSTPSEDIEPWAAVVLDKTFQLITQCLFALIGVVLLLAFYFDQAALEWSLAGIVFLALLATGFWRLQRRGLMGLGKRLMDKVFKGQDETSQRQLAAAMDQRIQGMYHQPRRMVLASLWRMGFRFGMAGEVYLIMGWLGHPVGYLEAIVLESLGQTVRMAAFMVPAGLGVQELTLTLLGSALGIPPIASLSLSMGKRLRELVVGLPALMGWLIWWRPR
jgi:putative membrane protein